MIYKVFVVIGYNKNLENFLSDIFDKKPPLAEPKLESKNQAELAEFETFSILQSKDLGEANISIPNDLFLCNHCLAELNDPADRRYRYRSMSLLYLEKRSITK